ncbi:MAG TPA: ammonium transporter, partial [Paraburkholderia sp.]|nr:ammonium transporter [Paraburkholderia sp.]
GIFGVRWLGGIGGVSLGAQIVGTLAGIVIAFIGGLVVYGALRMTVGLRIDREEEFNGADLSIHKITATPERETVA